MARQDMDEHTTGSDPIDEAPWLIVDLDVNLEHPKLVDLLAYWQAKRGGRGMPTRADIDPLELPGLLGNLFLLDVVGLPARYRYRLIGTKIVDAVGRDSTGRFVDEIYPGGGDALVRLYHYVAAQRRPVRNHGTVQWVGRDFSRYETLVLPLGDDRVSMLLGGMMF
jgi:hypothetical protein